MGVIFGTVLSVLAIFLILLVLVQRGRGGGLTGALGGMGGSSAFGAKAGDIFTRITIVTAGDLDFASVPRAVYWANNRGDRLGSSAQPVPRPPNRLRLDRRSKHLPRQTEDRRRPTLQLPAPPPTHRAADAPAATSPAADAPTDATPLPLRRTSSPEPLRNRSHQEFATLLASMTGFGEARGQAAGLSVHVEVRTINNRHFKLGYRSSDGYASLEPEVENVVRQAMRRGTVQVNLRVDRQLVGRELPHQHGRRRELPRADRRDLPARQRADDKVSLDTLLQLPGAVDEQARANIEPHEDWPVIEPVLQEALAAVNKMRIDEGKALLADLAANGQLVEQFLDKVAERAPAVAESYRERLAQRVNKALDRAQRHARPGRPAA